MTISGVRQLAAAVRDKVVSPRDLVEESLRRIDAANGALNAVVRLRARGCAGRSRDARRRPARRPARGCPAPRQGSHRRRRSADDVRLAVVRRRATRRDRCDDRRSLARRRCDRRRQDQHARVRLDRIHRQPGVRRDVAIPGTGTARRADRAAVRRRRSPPDSHRSRRRPTVVVRSASRRRCAASSATSRRSVSSDATRAPRWIGFSTSGATNATVADVVLEMSVLAGPTGYRHQRAAGARRRARARATERVVACRTLRADVDPAVEAAFDATLAAIEDDLGLPVDRRPAGLRRRRARRSSGSRSVRPSSRSRWPGARTAWDEFEPGLAGRCASARA